MLLFVTQVISLQVFPRVRPRIGLDDSLLIHHMTLQGWDCSMIIFYGTKGQCLNQRHFFQKEKSLFILAMLDLLSLHGLFCSCGERPLSSCGGLVTAAASPVAERGSRHAGLSSCGTWARQLQFLGSRVQAPVVVVHEFSYPTGRIFLGQGLNLYLPHWQVDSILHH